MRRPAIHCRVPEWIIVNRHIHRLFFVQRLVLGDVLGLVLCDGLFLLLFLVALLSSSDSAPSAISISTCSISESNGFDFNTSKNGSERYVVPINAWEDVLPMDIMPNPLYRAILVEDIEEMEQLGIWECDDEDFALCSFACPSKINVGSVIREGLSLLEREG